MRTSDDGLIDEADLKRYCRGGSLADWSDRATALLNQQRRNWPRAREGYAALTKVRTRPFTIEKCTVYAQFNPGRLLSAVADVDPEAIRARPCNLCVSNRPGEQLGLTYGDYALLANPAPIFSEHLTVVYHEHQPQSLGKALPTVIALAKDLQAGYTVLYNGPNAGASSPDHLHLQACRKGALPVEHDESSDWDAVPLLVGNGLRAERSGRMGRCALRLRSQDADALTRAVRTLIGLLSAGDEPAVNAVCRYDLQPAPGWTFIVFPRSRRRPSCYFAEGDDRVLVSPGVVEMSGVVILPRLEDFQRIDAETLTTVLGEVSLDDGAFLDLCARFTAAYQA